MQIVCGNKVHQGIRDYLEVRQVHHASTEEVRRCYATAGGIPTLQDDDLQAEARGEQEAEAGYERWLEDAGARFDPAGYEHDRLLDAQGAALYGDYGQQDELPAAAVKAGSAPAPATDAQLAFIAKLNGERVAPVAGKDGEEARLISRLEDVLGRKPITKREASDVIGWMKELPKLAQPQQDQAATAVTVAAGHYATASRTGNNDLDFWRVQLGKGRWIGRTFVQRVVGGHPDVNVRGQEARQALEAIAADPVAAAQRYGQEIGRCSRCNRHLTDETSRALGIGPECRSKAGA